MTNPASITRLGVEALTEGDPSAELQRLGAEVQSAGNAAAELQRLGVEVMSPQTQNAVIKRLGVEVMSSVVTQPQASHVLTYLAEIECYHPDDDDPVNLLYWTEDFTQSKVWTPWYGPAPVVQSNATLAPDGISMTADKVYGTPYWGLAQTINAQTNTDYSVSVYVKLGDGAEDDPYMGIGLYDPLAESWLEWFGYGDVGFPSLSSSAWTRLELTGQTLGNSLLQVVMPAAESGKYLYLFGAQCQMGSSVTTYRPVADAPTRTLRFSSLPYTSQIDDTPAQTHYESRLLQPGLLRRDLYSPGQPGGQITVGYGLVEIINAGDMDDYTQASFDGRSYVLKVGRLNDALADFTTVLKTTMESADFTSTRMTLKLRDRLAELDKPVTTIKYRGDDSELEGDSDLKDRYKPLIFGDVKWITPVLTNEAKMLYQVSSNPIDTTGVVLYEGGAQVTRGTDYTSQADMSANAPTSGQYRVWPEGGFLRLGFTPNLQISARIYADDDTRNVGEAFKQLAIAAGWPAAEINAADVTALDGAAGGTTNLFMENGGQALELMNRLAQGRGIWFGPDRLGILRMGLLAEPAGTPALNLTATDITRLERQSTATLPAKQITLKRDKNWTVHTEFVEGLSAATRQWLSNEWRQTIAIDTTNTIARKLAPVLEFESLINANEADTSEQAYRMLALYAAPRDIINLTVRARVADTLLLDLNDLVEVTYPRFGMDTGKLFRIIGIQADYRIGQLELTLWG
jgi:hypothetical protein